MYAMGHWIPLLTTCLLLCVIFNDGKRDIQEKKCNIDKQSVDCSHRGLSEIPNSTFPSDTVKIDLSWNSITKVNNSTFTGVKQLKKLDLSNNHIQHLDPMAFQGLEHLTSLNLNSNKFKLLPEIFSPSLFEPLVSLSTLRIQMFEKTNYSAWKGIDKSFAKLTKLRELFMDFPDFFVFGEGFANLTYLQTLSTAGRPTDSWFACTIQRLTNDTFRSFSNTRITELRLTHCKITDVQMGTFLALRNLSVLDISGNNRLGLRKALKSLYGLQHRNMSEINFSQLNGAFVTGADFSLCGSDTVYLKTICVRSIDFSKNYIFYPGGNCTVPSFGKPDCVETLKLFSHSIHYAPLQYLLYLVFYKSMKYLDVSEGLGFKEEQHSYPQHPNGPPPSSFMYRGKLVLPPLPRSLLTLNISSILSGIFLDHWDINISSGSSLQTLDLSYNGIMHCENFRINGTLAITQLDLSGLKCENLSSVLATFPKLQKLTLGNTPFLFRDIGDFDGKGIGFKVLNDLQEIDLSGNKLTDVNKNLFNNTYLRVISLSNNKLQRVPLAIMQLANISRLDLSVNAFTYLTAKEMSRFDYFNSLHSAGFRLNLGTNPFQCSCETLDFIRWVQETKIHLVQMGNYTCALPNGSRVDLAGFRSKMKDFSVSCISHTWLIVAVVSILFLMLMISLIYVVYRYRTNLRYWLYTKLTPPAEFLAQTEYVYDAFVAYCEDNYPWVRDDLCKTLEEEDFKLCVHNRDFTPGKPIHVNIVEKMKQSRKIVLVICVDFLNSTYGPLEIEYAGMKSLEEGREDLIICILREEIPVHEMPKPLRNLWHKITFLEWPADQPEPPHVWKQLRDALTGTHE